MGNRERAGTIGPKYLPSENRLPEANPPLPILAMSVDVEPWWASKLAGGGWGPVDEGLPSQVRAILDLLDQVGGRATFFILGEVAERQPEIVAEVHRRGHEVASHGYDHTSLHRLTSREFRKHEEKTTEVLRALTGERPLGYRAPSYSVGSETSWLYPVLRELGYRYSSSLFPMRTPFYGSSGFPFHPFPVKEGWEGGDGGEGKSLVEFPLTVYRMKSLKFIRIPVCGGVYLRVQPSSLVIRLLRNTAAQRPVVFLIHPHDLFPPDSPPYGLGLLVREALFGSLGDTREKFHRILQSFHIKPLKEVLFPADP
ncbi:MAG: polysaccharide deacetylase family protein [Actinomycetota bacterium]